VSGSILVDLPRMEAAESYFRECLYALEAELGRLDANLHTSLSAWDGEARDAYQVARQRWKAAADEMARNLAWLHGVVKTAHGNYSSARQTNIGMWRGKG
jgi:ESAT-6 family protein